MTTPTEVMSLAREALKYCRASGRLDDSSWGRASRAIDALDAMAQQASVPSAEPVARVDSWTSGSYWRNYKLTWLNDVPEGTMLYAGAAPLMANGLTEAETAGKWDGAEEWMSLAWELCADECGEDACTELVWEGGPAPEPWGDRWLKYEDEAKRLIALVRKHVPAAATQETAATASVAGLVDAEMAAYSDGAYADHGSARDQLGRFAAAVRANPPAASAPTLEDIEQYRLQMAGISTAAIGYWKEGDSIHPDYDTLALRDVAKLYAKYAALYEAASAPTVQPLTEEQIDELAGLHCLYPRRFAKSVMHACAAAWGVTMAGITAAQPPAAMPVPGGMTDAEIDAVTCAQWGEQLGSMVQAHRAYARAILAAQSVPATGAQPWQPIETAPKDGRTVIVTRHMGSFGWIKGHARWQGGAGWFSGWISHGFDPEMSNLGLAHPTNWMPLPASPTAPTGSAG